MLTTAEESAYNFKLHKNLSKIVFNLINYLKAKQLFGNGGKGGRSGTREGAWQILTNNKILE